VDDDLVVGHDVVERPDGREPADREHDTPELSPREQAECLRLIELDEFALRIHWNLPEQLVSQ
jgi:hypothetical protein